MSDLFSEWPAILIALISIGGTWILKAKYERLEATELRIREDRRMIYSAVLQPFILLLCDTKNKANVEKAFDMIKSSEYTKSSFDLIFVGSDAVVNSYIDLMQFFFKTENNQDSRGLFIKFSEFMICIRKDLGNPKTTLEVERALGFKIKDIETIFN